MSDWAPWRPEPVMYVNDTGHELLVNGESFPPGESFPRPRNAVPSIGTYVALRANQSYSDRRVVKAGLVTDGTTSGWYVTVEWNNGEITSESSNDLVPLGPASEADQARTSEARERLAEDSRLRTIRERQNADRYGWRSWNRDPYGDM